jgi:hypothetical protein
MSLAVIQTKSGVCVYWLIIVINLSGNLQGVLFKKQYQPNRNIFINIFHSKIYNIFMQI